MIIQKPAKPLHPVKPLNNVLAMPSAAKDLVSVKNPMWVLHVKTPVIEPHVFQMHNVSYRTEILTAVASLASKCPRTENHASISTSVEEIPAEKAQFARIRWDPLSVNVLQARAGIPSVNALVTRCKNAQVTQTARKVRPACQAGVYAGGDTTEMFWATAKTSTSVWISRGPCAESTRSAKTCQAVMTALVPKASREIRSSAVKRAMVHPVDALHHKGFKMASVSCQGVQALPTASHLQNVSRSQVASATAPVPPGTRQVQMETA